MRVRRGEADLRDAPGAQSGVPGLAAIRLQTRVADALTDEMYILSAGRKACGRDFLALIQRARKAAPEGPAVEILSIVLHRSAEGLDAGGVMTRHGASADGP